MKIENQSIGIFGTGGMALEVGDIVYALGGTPIYISKDGTQADFSNFEDEVIQESQIEEYPLSYFCIGVGDGSVRKKIFEKFSNRLNFVNLIHPSATVGHLQHKLLLDTQGVVIAAGARLTNNIQVGKFCIINQNATISHHCKLGDYIHVACGANISGHVELGDNSWVGAGASINNGSPDKSLTIGYNTIIGSGAVVLKDCDNESIYVGNPARKIK